MITMSPISQKMNSTKLFWATRSMQNTIKADQVTHMKTKPKFLCALKFQDMKDLDFRATPQG